VGILEGARRRRLWARLGLRRRDPAGPHRPAFDGLCISSAQDDRPRHGDRLHRAVVVFVAQARGARRSLRRMATPTAPPPLPDEPQWDEQGNDSDGGSGGEQEGPATRAGEGSPSRCSSRGGPGSMPLRRESFTAATVNGRMSPRTSTTPTCTASSSSSVVSSSCVLSSWPSSRSIPVDHGAGDAPRSSDPGDALAG
jgi:hypothetical protein